MFKMARLYKFFAKYFKMCFVVGFMCIQCMENKIVGKYKNKFGIFPKYDFNMGYVVDVGYLRDIKQKVLLGFDIHFSGVYSKTIDKLHMQRECFDKKKFDIECGEGNSLKLLGINLLVGFYVGEYNVVYLFLGPSFNLSDALSNYIINSNGNVTVKKRVFQSLKFGLCIETYFNDFIGMYTNLCFNFFSNNKLKSNTSELVVKDGDKYIVNSFLTTVGQFSMTCGIRIRCMFHNKKHMIKGGIGCLSNYGFY